MAADGFFRCLVSGVDLCMNGGTCQQNPNDQNDQFCICPDGYTNDRTVFHQSNCALPSNALLGVVITSGLMTAILLTALLRIVPVAKGRAKRIVLWACGVLVATFGHALALYLEQGQFQADSICLLLLIAVACGWAIEVSEILALPIFSIYPTVQMKVKRQIRLSFALVLIAVAAATITMSIFALDSMQFNRASVAYQLILFGCELVFAGIVVHYARQLNSYIKEVNFEITEDDIPRKIRALQLGALSLALTQIPLVTASLVFIAIGSLPYMWVFVFMLILVVPPCVTWSTLGIFKGHNKTNNSQQNARAVNLSYRNSKLRRDTEDTKDSKETKDIASQVAASSIVVPVN